MIGWKNVFFAELNWELMERCDWWANENLSRLLSEKLNRLDFLARKSDRPIDSLLVEFDHLTLSDLIMTAVVR